MLVLQITDLCKRFRDVRALDHVSLHVAPGEMVGFVGANGAGKSTTMRIAMGLVAADEGTVQWNGQPLTFATRQRFGYMPEQRGLYPKMRIVDQVAYFGELRGMPAAAAARAAAELIGRMQVLAEPNALLQTLSLGNQQRVQLAAALVHDPQLLILDEPFSGLDPVGVDTMADTLAQRRAHGVGVLFSSHQLDLVERLCDRIVIITAGRVVASGTLAELRQRAGRQELEVAVTSRAAAGAQGDAGSGDWVEDVLHRQAGIRLVSRDAAVVRLGLDRPEDDQLVLAAALAAGRVTHFGWRQPPLSELYRDTVAS